MTQCMYKYFTYLSFSFQILMHRHWLSKMSTLVSRGEKMSKIHESTQETGTKKNIGYTIDKRECICC